jgi:hypothetical protein
MVDRTKQKSKDEAGATVDEQIGDSFPASDPPSYNAGGRVGRPPRKSEVPQSEKTRPEKTRSEKPRSERPRGERN